MRYGNDFFKLADQDAYFKTYANVVKALLKRPHCTIRLAVLSDAPDVVIGWSAQEGKVLHFVFVRWNARKRGIGRSLVPGPVDLVTHMTNLGRAIWKKQKHTIKFNPF